MQDQRQQFLADFCRDIGGNQVKAALLFNMIKAVAEDGPGIFNLVACNIFIAVFNCHKVFINQQCFSLWCQACHCYTDGAITTTQVQTIIGGIDLHVFE